MSLSFVEYSKQGARCEVGVSPEFAKIYGISSYVDFHDKVGTIDVSYVCAQYASQSAATHLLRINGKSTSTVGTVQVQRSAFSRMVRLGTALTSPAAAD